MIASNPESLCKQSRLYYYDLLYDKKHGLVPDSIIRHIEHCQNCQEQINRLEGVLSGADGIEPQQDQTTSAFTTMMKLHFAYAGKHVTCRTARPFLSGLLDPDLEIRIPTPITAHIDNCRQCSEDLETIRNLMLTRTQLLRLSQLLAEGHKIDTNLCQKTRKVISSVSSMNFKQTNVQILKHLCKCTSCRRLLYAEREKLRDVLPEQAVPSEFPCEKVSMSDIFDYAVPYGIDPANDQYSKFRESLTLHLRSCPECLAKIQQLENAVYEIAERPESEVVTIYRIDESSGTEAAGGAGRPYAGYPIRVETAVREDSAAAEHPARTINFIDALRRKTSKISPNALTKIGVAAAAVLLLSTVLVFNIPAAKAIPIKQIYRAVEKIRNVHITRLFADETEPRQEKWVSRTLNVYIIKRSNQLVLWDVPNLTETIRYLDSAKTVTEKLTGDLAADIGMQIKGYFGLLPFSNIKDIPRNSRWSRITDDGQEITAGGNTDVYELTWVEEGYDGSLVSRKWRVFADSKTKFPRRTELYRKSPDKNDFVLQTVKTAEYLSDSEMEAVIKDASF